MTSSFTNSGGPSVNPRGAVVRRGSMNKNALLIPVLLLSLSGCSLFGVGGGAEPRDDDESSGGEPLGGGTTSCLVDRDWQLDVGDQAQQLAEAMTNAGANVIGVVGEGEQAIYFDHEGIAGSATSVTYTITIDAGDGLIMTMVQHHEGTPGGNWSFSDDDESVVVFDGWSGDYVVTTDTTINGVAAPTSTSPIGGGLDGQSMTIACDGSTMSTQAEGSPFVQLWRAN
jgi:hypothetical protein